MTTQSLDIKIKVINNNNKNALQSKISLKWDELSFGFNELSSQSSKNVYSLKDQSNI